MDHSKASVIAEVVQAQSNSSDLFKQSIYAGECFSLASEQFAVYFSLRMRTLSMVLRPYIYFFFFWLLLFPAAPAGALNGHYRGSTRTGGGGLDVA